MTALPRLLARSRLGALVLPVAGLAAWELAAGLAVPSFLIAPPSAMLGWLAEHGGLVLRALGATLAAAAAGFVIGNLAAVALAVAALLRPRLAQVLSALALLVFCLPFVATGPILRVLAGPGPWPQIILAALACSYTTYLALLLGLRAAPASWFDLVRSYGRGALTELVRVRARAALPYLTAGLQIAAPAAFLGAMVGEFTGAERGLGVLTIRTTAALDVAGTWAIAAVAALVSILAYAAIGAVGTVLSRTPPPLLLAQAAPSGRGAGLSALPLAALLALLLWQAGMDLAGLSPFFAKRPGDVWAFLFTDPAAAQHRATLMKAFAQTMALAVPGYLAGLALGAGLAVAVVLWPRLTGAVLPLAVALRSVPIVTTAPLIVLALGRGAAGTITVTAVMIFFPTLVACLSGLTQAPPQIRDLFASYGASARQRLRHAQLPAMLPALFAAARMAVPAALLAATTTEWLATGIGMGTLMALSASVSDYGMLWSAVVLLCAAAALCYAAVGLLEQAVLRRMAPEQLRR